MALDQNQLAETLGVDVADIKAAVESSDTVKLKLDGIRLIKKGETVYSEEDFTTLKTNHTTELKDKETYSQQVGRELILKEMKETVGLEYEGRKDPSKFIEAFKSKLTKELGEPDVKVKSLEGDLEKVRTEYATLEDDFKKKDVEIADIKLDHKKKEDVGTINTSIQAAYKEKKDLFKFGSDDTAKLYLLENSVKVVEGVVIPVDENGEPRKNKLRSTESLENHFFEWAEKTDKFKKPDGGRGDNFKGVNGVMSTSDFTKAMKSKGIEAGSSEFQRELQKQMKEGAVK